MIICIVDWPKEVRSRNVTQIIREKLPEENYELFKYLVEFLVRVCFIYEISMYIYIIQKHFTVLQVMECEDLNKMTSSNLAIVFGPNFLWSGKNNTSLEAISPINAFIDYVLVHHKDIYLVDINQRPMAPSAL